MRQHQNPLPSTATELLQYRQDRAERRRCRVLGAVLLALLIWVVWATAQITPA
ncbi:MAG: hypothetical protein H7330_14860 [Hymenobacteraceae bacterium]|nr:hypothetical protein [Hymenobacteraceae bacterium]